MSLAKAGRKLKRSGKTAVQFKFTSTFEYIDLECIGSWRPENLKVVWQRAHRKAESNNIHWVPVADRGPDGATGRALFDPTISVALIVTLYRDPKTTSFEEKVYKYYIEHEGASGKKVLASFHCDVAEYAGVPNTKSALELDCKPVSKKVRKAHIGVTLESEYIKEGVANDEDMQSTYSHITSVGVASSMDYHDSDEDTSPFPMNGTSPGINEGGAKEHEEIKLFSDKTTATIVECSGTFQREAQSEKQRASQLQEEGDSHLEEEVAVQHEKMGESFGQTENAVAIQPEKQSSSQLEDEGQSQLQEVGDSLLKKEAFLHEKKGEANGQLDNEAEQPVNAMEVHPQAGSSGEKSWIIVNGGIDVADQEARPEAMVDKEDRKGSIQESTVVDNNVVKKAGDSVSSHREDTEAEVVEVERPDLKQSGSDTGKASRQEVMTAQEVKPQEELKLQKVGWVESPSEPNRKETSLPPASWVMVTGGEHQDIPTSPGDGLDNQLSNKSSPEGQGVVIAAPHEAAKQPNKTAEGLNLGKSLTVKEMEGKSGMVEIDVTKADADPEAVKSQTQQQPSAQLQDKGPEAMAASVSGTYLPPSKPEHGRSLKGTQPETKPHAAVPEMSTAVSDKVENPTSSPLPPASQPWLPATVKLVNRNMTHVPISELDDKQIIGLYFTAQWCPPCRKFMPKLIKFYKVLRENNCRFHLIYVSSDHTEEDMFEYMQMQKVPFPAISFTSSVGEDLRQKYGVHQVPHLVIINRDCKLVDEQARKSVELAVTNTTAMQCYQDWLEGVAPKHGRKAVADGIAKAGSLNKEPSAVASGPPPRTAAVAAATEGEEREVVQSHAGRKTVQSQPRTKSATSEQLEEKIEHIRELEVAKEALQQTVTEVTEENVRLKSRVEELEAKLKEVHTVQSNLLREKKDLADQMNLRGWLMKRGVSGPTGRKWRRRFFRTDQGNQLCYYKGTTGEPQGWIDLLKVKDVRKANSEAQDKTNLTFEVVTEGRVYELLAENAPDMEKWMTAIKSLAEFCQRSAEGSQATPPPS